MIEQLHSNAYEFSRDEYRMRERVRYRNSKKLFISFSDTFYYEESQRRLAVAAAQTGEFDIIQNWSSSRLRQTEFYKQHRDVLDLTVGSGNWFWKPYIISQALQEVNDGDFVVFSDTGLQAVGNSPLPTIVPLLSWLAGSDRRVAAARLPGFTQSRWTKRDCFVLMGCDAERYRLAEQIQASYLAFRVSDTTRHLIVEWLRYASDRRILLNTPNELGLPNFEDFIDHRYDQSILSNLVYKLDLEVPFMHSPSKQIRNCIDEIEYQTITNDRPGPNLAEGRPWIASSASQWSPREGIYGVRSTSSAPFFFHTEREQRPSIEIDLGSELMVNEIRVYNRWDDFSQRARKLNIAVRGEDGKYEKIFDGLASRWHLGTPIFLRFQNLPCRHIRIWLEDEEYFHLDGIEIYNSKFIK